MCPPLESLYAVPYIIFTVRLYTCQYQWLLFLSAFSSPCISLCGHLSPSSADGVDEEVGRFVHHVQEVNQFKKVAMTGCRNLSPSLIATICYSSSLEELVVILSGVSVLSVCLTTPCIQTAFYGNYLPLNTMHLHLFGCT